MSQEPVLCTLSQASAASVQDVPICLVLTISPSVPAEAAACPQQKTSYPDTSRASFLQVVAQLTRDMVLVQRFLISS